MRSMRKAIAIILATIMVFSLGLASFATENPFEDVKESDWFYEDVLTVVAAKIIVGTDETHFSPDASLTRAMMATILWRLDGRPEGYTCGFSDVAQTAWYYSAVAWAKTVGIVSGVGSNKFAPNQALTREQMAAMLYRYASRRLYIQTTAFDLNIYKDANNVSSYAKESVRWLLSLDALHCEGRMIKPQEAAKRADVAAGAALFLKGDTSLVTVVGKSAYELAVENGYQGTVEEWLASLVGETGPAGAEGKSAYELAVENGYTGTETEWLASLVGATGAAGADGKSAYELAAENGYSGTLTEWLDSLAGAAGAAGQNGSDGKSAYDLAVENGYEGSLGEWLTSLVGADGEDGKDGADGKSAYELAAENGYTGTLQEWLASLVGADGKDGKDGADGKSAYEIAAANGYIGTEAEWLASLVGVAGKDGTNGTNGKDGADGKSAYEIAVDNGYTGTAQEWLASLAGTNGNDGANGKSAYEIAVANGYTGTEVEWLRSLAGKDGKSAYEIAVDHGYTGTEIEWLASLVGEAGAAGKDGANGKSAYELAVANGYTGTEREWLASLVGPTGAAGKDGKNGTNGKNGTDGKSAYELAVELGYTGDLASWLDSLRGANGTNGKDGKDGANGASAYELAVANGYSGTLTEWLASLVGAPGKDGKNGANGKDGTNGSTGKSAYELAVENGYTGTVQEWLTSLVGAAGKDGKNGTNGKDGANGKDGSDGKSAYELAVENGYAGTEEEWLASLAGTNGADGVGVADAYVNDQLHLILVLSNGTEIDAGYVGVNTGSTPITTYTVTFKDYDGTVLKTQNVEAGGNATPPADPTRDGFTFAGWDCSYTNVQSDVIVTATYMQKPAPVTYYTVTFKDYNGTVLKTQQVEAGGSATPPANPTREGYTFTGWSGSYTNVQSNVTITAQYQQNSSTTYTVTFYDYDGTTVLAERTNVSAGGYAEPPANPTKAGATFLGWSGDFANVTENTSVRAVYDDEKNVLMASSTEGSVGDTVTVLISLDGAVKCCAFDINIMYDSNLELVSYDDDLDLSIVINTDEYENGILLNFSDTKDKTKQRDVVELTFRIKSTTKTALPIKITINSIKEVNGSLISDTSYTTVNGVVLVK